ncbi:hypothetical protein BDV41DRAFT_32184 [Aspergillus transmontanensis]|uniref:Uncharacterized protein n=1 Tax=Aspergillus transmontanensis TaxID=1034304 RepID=A0A5N6VGX0_9EURO|nr:hypothetical protein BDV41DRAFT_32184 [Aspergillus transmontanensis]
MLVGFMFECRSGSPQPWRKYEVVFGFPYLLLLLSSSWQMQIDKPVRLEKMFLLVLEILGCLIQWIQHPIAYPLLLLFSPSLFMLQRTELTRNQSRRCLRGIGHGR